MNVLVARCGAVILSLSIVACGFGDSKEHDPRPADAEEQAAIEQIIDQTAVMRGLVETPDNAANIVTAADYEPYKVLLDSSAAAGSIAFVRPAPFPDCADTTLTSVTFTDCEHEGHTVNGTVTLDGDPATGATITANLTDVFDALIVGTGTANLVANATISDTSVDGTITVTATVDPPNFEQLVLSATVTFANVVTDQDWCPIGGTLTVSGTLDQGLLSFNRTVEVELGPTCGEATLLLSSE